MAARLIRSHELLEVARLLTPPKAGPGRPRTAQLRRAVSTAYYALFHELVAQAAAELCGTEPDSETERQHASRWVAREHALELIDGAADSIERARRLEQSGDRSYRRFLRLMVGAVKVAKVRA